ncbi:MAG: PSD1 domain-containing protein [Candidatus Hydrogenedentes bacterium]|nr:PSD1 domain-containing protein [Candidatus Hydrogenedentota bacterium]
MFRFAVHTTTAALVAFGSASAFAAPDFATEIRPILERSCFACHGPERQKSGYRLDVRDLALRGGDSGKPAIVAHDSASSPLIQYISGGDPEKVMPPEKSDAQRLTPEEVALFRAWIDAGPAWPDELAGALEEQAPHWSLEPLVAPPVPTDTRNAIDAFIQAKLAEKGVLPSPEADRKTLIRRVYYDLTGLPPTPEAVDAFCADPNPLAYEDLVDRLLASPRYGERWARHWLDTIHFADSHGYEHDVARDNAWPYRDYVIQSFNRDTPWPRMIREQLAADYFYPDEPELTPALGYLGAGTFDFSTYVTAVVTFDYLDRDDLVTQTMSSFVSTTANCARCHNHKFDPIPQQDYYALQAVFSGVVKGDLAYDGERAVKAERARWSGLIVAADHRDAATLLKAENAPLVDEWLARRGDGAIWTPLDVDTFLSTEGATLTRGEDKIIVASGSRPDKDTYTLSAGSTLPEISALRLDVFPNDALPMKGPGRQGNGNFHLSEFEVRVFEPGVAEPVKLEFNRATADFNQSDWGVEKSIDGNAGTAWGIHPEVGMAHHAVFELKTPLAMKPGARLSITMKHLHGDRHVIGAFRLSAASDTADRVAALPASTLAAQSIDEAVRSESQHVDRAAPVLRYVAEHALAQLPAQQRIYTAARSVDIPDGAATVKMASLSEPKEVHRMERGDFSKPQEIVEPGALSALATLPARFPLKEPKNEAERRAALADWIASPENVLTWRSIVNRVWHYHIGRGLCDTPSDLGRMGGAPSHPELIDWLAVWFRDEAHGSLKALHRLIMTSDTYRQSSAHREEAAALDADNRLLWRQNRHRLDADAFRDYTLAATGMLDLTMGGPGVRNFTEAPGPQLTPVLDYQAYDWNSAGANRRSIYRFVWRGIADPFMEALDFPDLGLLSPQRGFSASSLQALSLYNNNFVLHHSATLAERLQAEATDLDGQVLRATRLLWFRDPNPEELAAFRDFASEYGLPALCRVLLNSNEFLFVD